MLSNGPQTTQGWTVEACAEPSACVLFRAKSACSVFTHVDEWNTERACLISAHACLYHIIIQMHGHIDAVSESLNCAFLFSANVRGTALFGRVCLGLGRVQRLPQAEMKRGPLLNKLKQNNTGTFGTEEKITIIWAGGWWYHVHLHLVSQQQEKDPEHIPVQWGPPSPQHEEDALWMLSSLLEHA